MTTYLLDTSVIVDVLNGKRGRDSLLKQLVHDGHLLACSSVQVTEVYAGLRTSEESATEELLRSLEYYEVTWDIARSAGLLKRDYARRGITLPLADVTIAAVALTHSLTLITDNTKHYPMKDLHLYALP
jgi:predicted nucleic acid-binding protein